MGENDLWKIMFIQGEKNAVRENHYSVITKSILSTEFRVCVKK